MPRPATPEAWWHSLATHIHALHDLVLSTVPVNEQSAFYAEYVERSPELAFRLREAYRTLLGNDFVSELPEYWVLVDLVQGACELGMLKKESKP